MNKQKIFFISLLFLISMLACVVPGLQTASAPALAPTADTVLLATMVAETVSAAIVLTEQTPPLAESTLAPTSIPIFTPTPDEVISPEVGPAGSELVIQADGSTLFVDGRAEYEITIPLGWLTVRLNEQEYLDAFLLEEAANEYVQKSLVSIRNLDPNQFRLFAFDAREDHIQNEFVTNLNFIWDEQGSISLDTEKDLKDAAAQSVASVPGLEILSTKISSTTNAVPFGLIESKLAAKNSSDENIVMFQKQFIFNAKTGTVVITLSTVESLKDTIFPEFDAMFETIKILGE